jgi:hypothetical protein
MDDRIRRELRILKAYAAFLTLALGAACLAAFRQATPTRFDQIDVQRINIVEPDGKLRMVLSNRPRSIGPIYKGQPFGYEGGGRPGIIFFNDEGTENGGITFAGKRGEDGRYQASSGMSFDQFDQDQVLYFQYSDDNGRRRVGFTIADRVDANVADILSMVKERDSIRALPDSARRAEALRAWAAPRDGQPLFAQRIVIGRDPTRSAVIALADPMGRPRLRMSVDSTGAASLDFLDEQGNVTARFPDRRR